MWLSSPFGLEEVKLWTSIFLFLFEVFSVWKWRTEGNYPSHHWKVFWNLWMNNATWAAFNLSLDSQTKHCTSHKTFQGLPAQQMLTAFHLWLGAMTFRGLSTLLGRPFLQAFPHCLDPAGHYENNSFLTSCWRRPEQQSECNYCSGFVCFPAFSDCKMSFLIEYP